MAGSRTTEVVRTIKPFVMRWINETVGGGVGAPSPHDLSSAHHSGSLADSQAPQFLKTDGSRTLTGNLAVSDAITIDGVDVSALDGDFDTHVAATAHAGHTGGVGVHTHQNAGEGGQLSVVALTDHTKVVHDALGLSHDSLSDVSADDHHNQVHVLTGTDHTASGLMVGHVVRATGASTFAWQQLQHGDLGGVSSDQHHAQVHTITGADHAVTGSQWDLVGLTATDTLGILTPSSDPGATQAILMTDASGILHLDELRVDTLDDEALGYIDVATHLYPAATDTYDLGSSVRLWRKGWLSEMEAVLFAENTITLLGGWFYVTKYAGTAQEDIDGTQTQIDLGADDTVMSQNDFVVFRQALQVEYVQLGSYVGSNVWNVTRDVDGSGANTWPQGAPFACFGYDGDGRIELNAYDTPRISLMRQGTSYNVQDELIRIGDLNGNWGYSSETWGVAIGEYGAGLSNVTIDQDGDLSLRTYATTHILLQADGDVFIGEDVSSPSSTNLAIFTNAQTYNSESVEAGDVLIGDNSSSKANIFWDKSTGQLLFRGGTTIQTYIDTDGSLTWGGGVGILNASGAVIECSTSAQYSRAFNFEDSSGELVGQVLGYVQAAHACTCLYSWDRGGANDDSTVIIISHPTGTGTGLVELYANNGSGGSTSGLVVSNYGTSAYQRYTQLVNSWLVVDYGIYVGGHPGGTTYAPTGQVWTTADVRVGGGLYIGSTGIDPDDNDLHIDGSINKSTAICAIAERTSNQSIPNNSWSVINFTSEIKDTDGLWDSGTPGRFTIQRDGQYLVGGAIIFAANATGTRGLCIRINGTTSYAYSQDNNPSASYSSNLTTSMLFDLSAGDNVQIMAYQNSGGNLNVQYVSSTTRTIVGWVVRVP